MLRLPFELRDARGKSLPDYCFEITRGRMSFRDFELRERIGDALDFDVAARSDVYGAAQRFGNLAKHLCHFHLAFEIKLVGLELHAVRVAHGLAGLYAQQHFMAMRVLVLKV